MCASQDRKEAPRHEHEELRASLALRALNKPLLASSLLASQGVSMETLLLNTWPCCSPFFVLSALQLPVGVTLSV